MYHMAGTFGQDYLMTLDFVNLVPELGNFMHDYVLKEVQEAVDSYNERAPYWFIAMAEEVGGEGTFAPLYDTVNLFNAKAMILQQSHDELEKYIDVPAFERGDLIYLQNLISTLRAVDDQSRVASKNASSLTGHQGETITYTLNVNNVVFTMTVPITVADQLPVGLALTGSLCASSAGNAPVCSGRQINWNGTLSPSATIAIWYTAQITTTQPAALTNQMVVTGMDTVYTRTLTVIANPRTVYLPVVLRK
jgi:uncharacterized repeat protein (TIGR01451 family)